MLGYLKASVTSDAGRRVVNNGGMDDKNGSIGRSSNIKPCGPIMILNKLRYKLFVYI